MATNLSIDDFDSFRYIKDVEEESINRAVIKTIKNLDEKSQLEPYLRSTIFDINETPHGPTEIADILTTKLKCLSNVRYSAFILKGKSFKTIKAKDVSHQIYRLKKIQGLEVSVLAYTGNLLDQPQEEFVSTCLEIGCDYSIWNAHDLSRLFISEGIICPNDGNIIEGNICSCGYNPKKESLNLFQESAIKELKTTHELKQSKGLIVLPTASGKTRVAAIDIINHEFKCSLYLAHTHEILQSSKNEFTMFFDEDELKIIRTKQDFNDLVRINFVTIQLLSKNLALIPNESFDYIIVDEFHHAAARTYLRTIRHFRFEFLLGLTATPFRSDRKEISELCDKNIIVNFELKDGIEAGILSPYHYFGCFDDIDYSHIRHNGISYDVDDLERALIVPRRDEAIIEKWKEKALNKSTLGFCCTQNHAIRCCENFNHAGINSKVYLSNTSYTERDQIIEEFKNGEIKIIFTVDVLNEGVDFPFVECLLFMRPTESKRIFLQQLGRGLRRSHGKTRAIVLDFIGNFKNAIKIFEYFGLSPELEESEPTTFRQRNFKEIFNLPLGCEITFDERVINVFSAQALQSQNITKHNIHRILVQQFINLSIRLNRIPRWQDIDRAYRIDSSIYKMFYKRPAYLAEQISETLEKFGIKI